MLATSPEMLFVYVYAVEKIMISTSEIISLSLLDPCRNTVLNPT